MNYGVTIDEGASEWQIFQQSADGTAAITITGHWNRIHLSQELPLIFEQVTVGSPTIKARIAYEANGESVLPWTLCEAGEDGTWRITFHKVPAGGLYRIETYMEYEGWDGLSCTRGDMVHHIGVGDIFVVAGQSNAAGRAKNPVEDAPQLGVHLLRNSGKWTLASHPLGETTGSIHIGHYENHNPGHTPWLHFAKILMRELGYPIGIIMSAYGGAPLRWFNPEENGALTKNMLEQLEQYQLRPKAVLWCQGEAEGYENSAHNYLERFTAFVESLRRSLENPSLPFITVQINRCLNETTQALDHQWGMVREAQVRAMDTIPDVYTIPSNDVAMYDFIHNSSQGNLVVGERCARCALATLYGRELEWQAPRAKRAVQTAPDKVELTFSRIYNWLNPFDVPAALLPFEAEDEDGLISVQSYETHNDGLTLHFSRTLKEGAVLHGAWRMNPGVGIPCDCTRMSMLSFYGMKIIGNENNR